jgi:hypothetical protein
MDGVSHLAVDLRSPCPHGLTMRRVVQRIHQGLPVRSAFQRRTIDFYLPM